MRFFDRFYHYYSLLCQRELASHLVRAPKSLVLEGRVFFSGIGKFTIGEECVLRNRISFEGSKTGRLSIGNRVCIGNNVSISCCQEVTIGDGIVIASNSYIIDSDHASSGGPGAPFDQLICSPVRIGKNVWITSGVSILRGSVIGDGAIIGAGAVVKGMIPANAIAVGVPAKVIKMRQ